MYISHNPRIQATPPSTDHIFASSSVFSSTSCISIPHLPIRHSCTISQLFLLNSSQILLHPGNHYTGDSHHLSPFLHQSLLRPYLHLQSSTIQINAIPQQLPEDSWHSDLLFFESKYKTIGCSDQDLTIYIKSSILVFDLLSSQIYMSPDKSSLINAIHLDNSYFSFSHHLLAGIIKCFSSFRVLKYFLSSGKPFLFTHFIRRWQQRAYLRSYLFFLIGINSKCQQFYFCKKNCSSDCLLTFD